MKKAILFLVLMMLCSAPFCQGQNQINYNRFSLPAHSLGDLSVSVSPNILINIPNSLQFAAGIKLRLFITKRISFDSDLVFGKDYIHAGPGLIGIPLWLVILGSGNSGGDGASLQDIFFYVALGILSVEHTSFHIPVKGSFDISPYVSLLRYKSAYEFGNYSDTNMTNEQFSAAAGLEFNKYFNRFLVSPYIEGNVGYIDHKAGINAGIYFGILFPGR